MGRSDQAREILALSRYRALPGNALPTWLWLASPKRPYSPNSFPCLCQAFFW